MPSRYSHYFIARYYHPVDIDTTPGTAYRCQVDRAFHSYLSGIIIRPGSETEQHSFDNQFVTAMNSYPITLPIGNGGESVCPNARPWPETAWAAEIEDGPE